MPIGPNSLKIGPYTYHTNYLLLCGPYDGSLIGATNIAYTTKKLGTVLISTEPNIPSQEELLAIVQTQPTLPLTLTLISFPATHQLYLLTDPPPVIPNTIRDLLDSSIPSIKCLDKDILHHLEQEEWRKAELEYLDTLILSLPYEWRATGRIRNITALRAMREAINSLDLIPYNEEGTQMVIPYTDELEFRFRINFLSLTKTHSN